ncbi:MAG: TMEM43 family protein [Marinifilaceae bacterium]|jgi:hypothetical protein|nr:TMEM43 family protein [Marinifilaceae bacterium]
MNEKQFKNYHPKNLHKSIAVLFAPFLGLLLLMTTLVLLVSSELRILRDNENIHDAQKIVVSSDNNQYDKDLNNRLVYTSGNVFTNNPINDAEIGMDLICLRLERNVLYYQWEEKSHEKHNKNIAGSDVISKEFYYEKIWSDDKINHNNFSDSKVYQNKVFADYADKCFDNPFASMGFYELDNEVISQFDNFQNLKFGKDLKLNLKNYSVVKYQGKDAIFIGEGDINNPEIGDILILYRYIPVDSEYTIVAKQDSSNLQAYTKFKRSKLLWVIEGKKSLDEVFDQKLDDNESTKWLTRLLFFIILTISLMLVVLPFNKILSFIPIFGNIASGTCLVLSVLLSIILYLVVLAILWMSLNIVYALCISVVLLILFVLITNLNSRKKTIKKQNKENKTSEVQNSNQE